MGARERKLQPVKLTPDVDVGPKYGGIADDVAPKATDRHELHPVLPLFPDFFVDRPMGSAWAGEEEYVDEEFEWKPR